MSELLQEYVDSGRQRLRVDRAAGVIRGVKLLGLTSRNGRRYREEALTGAVSLYENAKVNINHPKGHPLSPRDYQDRLGVVRGVIFRANEGLFGDLHFNPKHALSEQLVWDAEHAPQNVGMSHNVLARTTREGEVTVVEAITKVQSIDLVADPATTAGLFEHVESQERKVKSREPEVGVPCPALDSQLSSLDSVSLERLRRERPDLICAVESAYETRLHELQAQLDEMLAREAASRRRERIRQLLQEHNLPLPGYAEADSQLVTPQFIETLMRADEQNMRQLIEERANLVSAASRWNGNWHRNKVRSRSRDQLALVAAGTASPVQCAADFAAAIRTR
jgi:hypothetical protein